MIWAFEQAKENLDELFTQSLDECPQLIAYKNKTYVMLDEREYDRLIEEHRKGRMIASTEGNSAAEASLPKNKA